MKLIILGLPGSGKGSQAKLLEQRFGWKHVSTGDICRETAIKDTVLGKRVKQLLEEGKLVPDEIMNKMVVDILPKTDYILDGYPRTEEQAVFLDTISNPDAAILLNVSDTVVIERMLKRKREDDTKEIIKKRVEDSISNISSIADYYGNYGMLIIVDANKTIEEVDKEIRKKLKAKGFI